MTTVHSINAQVESNKHLNSLRIALRKRKNLLRNQLEYVMLMAVIMLLKFTTNTIRSV